MFLDAFFERFKQNTNKPSPICQSKVTLHRPDLITLVQIYYEQQLKDI